VRHFGCDVIFCDEFVASFPFGENATESILKIGQNFVKLWQKLSVPPLSLCIVPLFDSQYSRSIISPQVFVVTASVFS